MRNQQQCETMGKVKPPPIFDDCSSSTSRDFQSSRNTSLLYEVDIVLRKVGRCIMNTDEAPAESMIRARDAAHAVPSPGPRRLSLSEGSTQKGDPYGSAPQRALQLLRERQPLPSRRQSVPALMPPQGVPPLQSLAKPSLTQIHPLPRGKPPPPAGKPPTAVVLKPERRCSTGGLAARSNTLGAMRPPPPRGPPRPFAKPTAVFVGGAISNLQSTSGEVQRRPSDFRRPPPGPPPPKRLLSMVTSPSTPSAASHLAKPLRDGQLQEQGEQRNAPGPTVSTVVAGVDLEATAAKRVSFSGFQGPPPNDNKALDDNSNGRNSSRQSTGGGASMTPSQDNYGSYTRVASAPRPLPQLPKRRPSAELVGGSGRPPSSRPPGELPEGEIRRYSISNELSGGVGNFSRRASMASIDADAVTAPSILQSDDHNRRGSSDIGGRTLSLPAGEGGGREPSPPQALPGGPVTILWYNMGVTKQKELNSKGAVECYERAVEGGHAKAQHNLAAIYEKGMPGVPKDDFEAVRLFKLAADQGLAESCYSLAMHLKFGLAHVRGSVEPDEQRKIVAPLGVGCVSPGSPEQVEQGLAKAMFNLGLMYKKRRGVSPDAPESDLLATTRECYQAAAEAGVTKAMVNLGVLYMSGRLPGHKPEEALEWFKKAGDEGDTSGLWNLSLCYDRGIGVPRDKLAAQALQQQCRESERDYGQKRVVLVAGAKASPSRRRASEPLTPTSASLGNPNDPLTGAGGERHSRRRFSSAFLSTPPPPEGPPPTRENKRDSRRGTSPGESKSEETTTRGSTIGYKHVPSSGRPVDSWETCTREYVQRRHSEGGCHDPRSVSATVPGESDGAADGEGEHRGVDGTDDSEAIPPPSHRRKDSLLLKPTPLAIARVKAAVERRKALEVAAVRAAAAIGDPSKR